MKKINPIFYWPSWFLISLDKKTQRKINIKTLNSLAKAQIYLWDALNIYDDILDGSTNAKKLPEANKLFRNFLEIYYRLNLPADFYKLFNSLFVDLDKANQEEFNASKIEIQNSLISPPKKYSDFSDLSLLSRKSLALSVGPIAVLYLSGDPQSINKVKTLKKFFKYALAAKQLSDDSRDWFEDLNNVSLTYPNTLILKLAQKEKITIDLKNKPEIAYLLFTKVVEEISKNIKLLCKMAREEAKAINIKDSNPLLLNIVSSLEKAVIKAEKFAKLL